MENMESPKEGVFVAISKGLPAGVAALVVGVAVWLLGLAVVLSFSPGVGPTWLGNGNLFGFFRGLLGKLGLFFNAGHAGLHGHHRVRHFMLNDLDKGGNIFGGFGAGIG